MYSIWITSENRGKLDTHRRKVLPTFLINGNKRQI